MRASKHIPWSHLTAIPCILPRKIACSFFPATHGDLQSLPGTAPCVFSGQRRCSGAPGTGDPWARGGSDAWSSLWSFRAVGCLAVKPECPGCSGRFLSSAQQEDGSKCVCEGCVSIQQSVSLCPCVSGLGVLPRQ